MKLKLIFCLMILFSNVACIETPDERRKLFMQYKPTIFDTEKQNPEEQYIVKSEVRMVKREDTKKQVDLNIGHIILERNDGELFSALVIPPRKIKIGSTVTVFYLNVRINAGTLIESQILMVK